MIESTTIPTNRTPKATHTVPGDARALATEGDLKAAKARFRKALDEVFEAGRAYKTMYPSVTSFVADEGAFKVEFAGPELYQIRR